LFGDLFAGDVENLSDDVFASEANGFDLGLD
jgi:hypothetical protein